MMKALFIFLTVLLVSSVAFAQPPREYFSYQGVARDHSGKVLVNQAISLRFTIMTFGVVPYLYQEKHKVTTNSTGVFNLFVGGGTKLDGNFQTINWSLGPYFLKVDLDPAGGDAFTAIAMSQLVSVPYALHTTEAEHLIHNDPIVQNGAIGNGGILNVSGIGSKMIWYPRKAAFRAGTSNFDLWNDSDMGQGSVAFGITSNATANSSSAFGLASLATGEYSFAAGYKAKSSAEAAVSMGFESQALGNGSVALGYFTQAIDVGTFAAGHTTKAKGHYSFAAGYLSEAIGDASLAIGRGVISKAFGSVTLGAYNNLQDNPNGASIAQSAATDRVFQIGNGTSETSLSNAITILRNGRVGIGNGAVNPQAILEIDGRPRLRHNGSTAGLFLNTSQQEASTFIGMRTDKQVGFFIGGDWRFYVNDAGDGVLNGQFLQTSDRRLKRDFTPLSNSLSTLTRLDGYHYYWKNATSDQRLQTGLIAQEVEELFPELVTTDKEGFKAVNYIGLIPHLIEAVKELKAENDYLKKSASRLSELEASVADLLKTVKAAQHVEQQTK